MSNLRLHALNLREDDFDKVIALGNLINGDNYLDHKKLDKILGLSCRKGINCSWVLYELPNDTPKHKRRQIGKLIGFRLTYAPENWKIDKWCSVSEWGVNPKKVCYFKANMIDEKYRGKGLGRKLLKLSINGATQLGAKAGITHIWSQSPGNSAYKYFSKAGGEIIKVHPSRWNEDCKNEGYCCVRCGNDCHCDAIEMILYF